MQNIQTDLELLQTKNTALEADFEQEITRKNNSYKEIGQIINSVNNIFAICKKQSEKRGKTLDKNSANISEETKDLVKKLVERLDRAHSVIDELVKVYNAYGQDYNREAGYAEEIEAEN